MPAFLVNFVNEPVLNAEFDKWQEIWVFWFFYRLIFVIDDIMNEDVQNLGDEDHKLPIIIENLLNLGKCESLLFGAEIFRECMAQIPYLQNELEMWG